MSGKAVNIQNQLNFVPSERNLREIKNSYVRYIIQTIYFRKCDSNTSCDVKLSILKRYCSH